MSKSVPRPSSTQVLRVTSVSIGEEKVYQTLPPVLAGPDTAQAVGGRVFGRPTVEPVRMSPQLMVVALSQVLHAVLGAPTLMFRL